MVLLLKWALSPKGFLFINYCPHKIYINVVVNNQQKKVDRENRTSFFSKCFLGNREGKNCKTAKSVWRQRQKLYEGKKDIYALWRFPQWVLRSKFRGMFNIFDKMVHHPNFERGVDICIKRDRSLQKILSIDNIDVRIIKDYNITKYVQEIIY